MDLGRCGAKPPAARPPSTSNRLAVCAWRSRAKALRVKSIVCAPGFSTSTDPPNCRSTANRTRVPPSFWGGTDLCYPAPCAGLDHAGCRSDGLRAHDRTRPAALVCALLQHADRPRTTASPNAVYFARLSNRQRGAGSALERRLGIVALVSMSETGAAAHFAQLQPMLAPQFKHL